MLMKPIKLSALYQKHLSLNSTMTEFHGWQTAAYFTSPEEEANRLKESVGLADMSWLLKFDIKGKISDPKSKIQNLKSIWPLARGHWLAIGGPDKREAMTQEVNQLTAHEPCLHTTDATSVYAALLLAGPKSREVLNRLTALNLSNEAVPNLAIAQTSLAHVHAIVLRQDIGEIGELLSYLILVSREYGEYVWETIMHAGQEFDIAPFGLRAQQLIFIV